MFTTLATEFLSLSGVMAIVGGVISHTRLQSQVEELRRQRNVDAEDRPKLATKEDIVRIEQRLDAIILQLVGTRQ